jgi:hypothetical protein
MQSFIGYTQRSDLFFFRDNDQFDEQFRYGLFPDRWDANDTEGTVDDCHRGGNLDNRQGMIFVR